MQLAAFYLAKLEFSLLVFNFLRAEIKKKNSEFNKN